MAISGAVRGTLFPQIIASINLFDRDVIAASGESSLLWFANASILLVGTLSALASFHFGGRIRRSAPAKEEQEQAPQRNLVIEAIARLGRMFIAITFGVLFAGVYSAALSALIERLFFLVNFIKPLLQPLFASF